jgi:predicted anti-sigma-YlaC factor YlaD
MNCEDFQNGLLEYLEGTLSPSDQAATEEHLAHCGSCREAVEREQRLAQFLSHESARSTAALHLGPDVRRRIAARLAPETREQIHAPGKIFAGLRLAWPTAIAVSVLVAAIWFGGFFLRPREPKSAARQPHGEPRPATASIRISYLVPVYTFRREGNLVIDALTWTTNVVDQALWVKN